MSELIEVLESVRRTLQDQRVPTKDRIAFIPRWMALDAIAEAADNGKEMSLQPCQKEGREGYDVLIGHGESGFTVYAPSEDDL